MPHLAENLMKIVWLVPEMQAVESLQKIDNKGNFSIYLAISQNQYLQSSSNSFCLITADISIAGI